MSGAEQSTIKRLGIAIVYTNKQFIGFLGGLVAFLKAIEKELFQSCVRFSSLSPL